MSENAYRKLETFPDLTSIRTEKGIGR